MATDLSGTSSLRVDKPAATPSTTPGATPDASRIHSPVLAPEREPTGGMSVGTITGKKGLVMCSLRASLTDATDLLIGADRTAALVLDDDGTPVGVLTENDLLLAYVEGVHWECSVELWLHGKEARLPQNLLPALSIRTTATLGEAARQMRAQRGGDQACHHLLVKDETDAVRGVLSALDVARALASLSSELEEMAPGHAGLSLHGAGQSANSLVAELVGDALVEEAMKPRDALPACPLRAPLVEAFKEMASTKQNCVLIVANTGSRKHVHGIITPRDLLRAFAEHMPGDTSAGRYLRGLQASMEPRTIAPSAGLVDAAALMAASSLHHLVVREPGSSEVAGVLSALDILCYVQI
eukprot:CAMPEP_0179105942 /NCGR_PEP_ID=MMETSP0796-20121207/49226_1 /TAXON_ID=73915 /ORGANISM="Pyrodinium bahamense, Strain pbaha01" /LENGTH=354 /DNA_ID=CAMNT_0020803941 /DNA_START=91 /DNA_END=1155 /DNA_ORIENTATION=-